MTLLGDLWAFVGSIVSQWQGLVTGSLLTALVFVIERWREVQMPRRTIVAVFVGIYLPVATFLAWRDERVNYDRLEAETSAAQTLTLDMEERMQAVLLRGKGASISLFIHSRDPKTREFAQRIRTVFQRASWSLGGGDAHPRGSGRSLRILADDTNSTTVNLLETAFTEANLRYRTFRVCQGTPVSVEIGESEEERRPVQQ